MSTPGLALRYLMSRPLSAVLNLMLLTLGLASITFVLIVSHQVGRAFERDLAGIDAVVGAKGSPLQLILSAVLHIDVPTGNVPLEAVEALARHPQVAQVIPLSLGDSFRGFRIVGTTPAYVSHYRASVVAGRLWSTSFEAVAGSEVARATGLAEGVSFIGTHGLGGGGHAHGDRPYRVVGLLAPCGCVLDRLILTSTESVWEVHEVELAVDEEDRKALVAERELTAALVRYRSPLAAVSFPRWVNTHTPMQAAAPAIEVTRLLRLLGLGGEVLTGLGAVVLSAAGLSVFVGLWNAVRERRADLALLRMLGAPPSRVAALVLCEALWLAALATVLGLLLGHGLTALVASVLESSQSLGFTAWQWVPGQAWVPAAAVAVATVAALIPAISAYRTAVITTLQSR